MTEGQGGGGVTTTENRDISRKNLLPILLDGTK